MDLISNNKLHGIYEINDDELSPIQENQLNLLLKKYIKKSDLVILSDYGHGLISSKSAKLICKYSKFLVLNAQLNAANFGHHDINKFNNSNCIIINEGELRHELRNKSDRLEKLLPIISKKLRCKNIVVTRGSNGSLFYQDLKKKYTYCPAFASKVVDKIGSGDAMLSLLSILLKNNLNIEVILFLSSLAGAQSVQTMGNSESVDKVKLLKAAEYLMK